MEEHLLNTPSGNGIGLFASLLGTSWDVFKKDSCGIGRRKLWEISTFLGDCGSTFSWTDSDTLSLVLNLFVEIKIVLLANWNSFKNMNIFLLIWSYYLSRRRPHSGWFFFNTRTFSSKTSSSPAIDFNRSVLLLSTLESGGIKFNINKVQKITDFICATNL